MKVETKVNYCIMLMALVTMLGFVCLIKFVSGFWLAVGSLIIGITYAMSIYEANLEYIKRGDIK